MAYTPFSGSTGSVGSLNTMLQQLFLLREFVSDPGYTATTPRMTFKADGKVVFGIDGTFTGANQVSIQGTRCVDAKGTGVATDPVITVWHTATAGDNVFASFRTEATDTARGSISYNRGAGLVAYNTTSDYRAKTLQGPVLQPGSVIDAMQVYTGLMNGATQQRPMFVAHELQAVAPYAVTGTKDQVDAEGAPVLQQVDHASLVPLLVAELKALRARVAQLEAAQAAA